MGRRATKKLLRRAEQAVRDQRYVDAEGLYRALLDSFQHTSPTLLDFAGGVMGMVRVLYLTNRDDDARYLAQSAYAALSSEEPAEVVAA